MKFLLFVYLYNFHHCCLKMLAVQEFDVRVSDGRLNFDKPPHNSFQVDEQAIQEELALARRFSSLTDLANRLTTDCNYLVETYKELQKAFNLFSEITSDNKNHAICFTQAFKKNNADKNAIGNDLCMAFNKIFNMLDIKKTLAERLSEYEKQSKSIASPVNILLIAGLGSFLKDIGAEESGGNYNAEFIRPTIFGVEFPSHAESCEFSNWNKTALVQMKKILVAEPSLDVLQQIMNIKSPLFDKFRKDRLESQEYVETMLKEIAEKEANERASKYLSSRKNEQQPLMHTRTFAEHISRGHNNQSDSESSDSRTNRSNWSDDSVQTYRPSQKSETVEKFRPRSPTLPTSATSVTLPTSQKPKSESGWQTVKNSRKK